MTKTDWAFKHRIFWTWDHSTNWDLNEPGCQYWGANHPYLKRPESFLKDYKRLVDFMGDHGMNGLIVWGFLRDSHGGIKAAQELCDYANARGVRILPGVGVNAYGGIYYEGDHEFSLSSRWHKCPEMRAETTILDFSGSGESNTGKRYYETLCPSKQENLDWYIRGIEWLFKNFDIGGVNLETGDYGMCSCDDCKAARVTIEGGVISVTDMGRLYPPIVETAWGVRPDAWMTYATYSGFTKEAQEKAPDFLRTIPEDAICQWTLTRMLQKNEAVQTWKELKPSTKHNIGYMHHGTRYAGPGHTRHDVFIQSIKEACVRAAEVDFEGLVMSSEVPATNVEWELNYLAFQEFCGDPSSSWEDFARNRLSEQYGGEELAVKFINFVLDVDHQFHLETNLQEALRIKLRLEKDARDLSGWHSWHRWSWLTDRMYRNMIQISDT